MKPAPFDYFAPETLQEALQLLEEGGGDAKPLAGGQSLVPSMNFRLAQPSALVDLNGITDLFGIREGENGGLRIGAMTRQRSLERSALVARHSPLLAEALPYIAHPQIRNRGTLGGSLAHADPAAELPAVALAVQAQMRIRSSAGERAVPADEFFFGLFTTALEPDELLVEIELPALPPRTGTAFQEFARRHGDYALAGACSVVTLAEDGTIAGSRLVLFSVGDAPVLVLSAGELLLGTEPTLEAIQAAAEAVDDEIDPPGDIHATASYRRHLVKVLSGRVIALAVERARQVEAT
jgi:aerobic carbon-monoxide dehydrogenase medium subunit